MKFNFTSFLLGLTIAFTAARSNAQSAPIPNYYKGFIEVRKDINTTFEVDCFAELTFINNNVQVQARTALTLPHLNPQGEFTPISLPETYTAIFNVQKNSYVFRDSTPKVLIKSLVVFLLQDGLTPEKLGVEYWHASARHHDSIFCKSLELQTTPEQIEDAKDQLDTVNSN